MKISLDLDGTIWSHMKFFREFMRFMQTGGNQVGVLTAHRDIHRDADLLLLASMEFPRPSFTLYRPYRSNETYAEFKARVIVEEKIDMHFDDCNYGSAETEAAMRNLLGKEAHRLVKVTPRFPEATRYE